LETAARTHFKPAHFYGAVEDVLVQRTRQSTPKLIAVKRNQCRLPLPDFSDPALFEKVESPADVRSGQ